MNFRSLVITVTLIGSTFAMMPAVGFNSRFMAWANTAIVTHFKEGSKALGADVKNLGSAAASVAKQSLNAGHALASTSFNVVNNAINMFPVPALLAGVCASVATAAFAEDVHTMQTRDRLSQLNNLYWLVESFPGAADIKTIQIHNTVAEVDHFSGTVKDAFEMFEAVADELFNNPDAYQLARAQLLRALEADIAQVKKNTVANCIGFTGLGTVAAITGYKIAKNYLQKS